MSLSAIPSLIPAPGGAVMALADGTVRSADLDEARTLFRSGEVLVVHAAFVAGRLKTAPNKLLFDVLELFIFVRPAQPCVPSALGLARALGQPVPVNAEESARALHSAADALIAELRSKSDVERAKLRPLVATLTRAGWRWGSLILDAIGQPESQLSPIAGLDAWRGLPQWEDEAPPASPGSLPVDAKETRDRLFELVRDAGEARAEQA